MSCFINCFAPAQPQRASLPKTGASPAPTTPQRDEDVAGNVAISPSCPLPAIPAPQIEAPSPPSSPPRSGVVPVPVEETVPPAASPIEATATHIFGCCAGQEQTTVPETTPPAPLNNEDTGNEAPVPSSTPPSPIAASASSTQEESSADNKESGSLSGKEVVDALLYLPEDDPDYDPDRLPLAVEFKQTKFFPRTLRKAASKVGRGIMRIINVRTELAWRRERRDPPAQGRTYTNTIPQTLACDCGKFPCEHFRRIIPS